MRRQSPRKAGRHSPVAFEELENRALFSQILVSAYGAVANDNRDDRNAVVAAFNAARAGDTIVFGSGKYEFAA